MKIQTLFPIGICAAFTLSIAMNSIAEDSIYDLKSSDQQNKGKILMISADDFNDTELLYPLYRLTEAGYDVTVASPEGGTIKGYNSAEITNTKKVADVQSKVGKYKALYLPGGKAPATLRKDDKVLEIVNSFASANKLIGSICHGPQILISAGLVEGKKVTSVEAVASEIKEAKGTYVDEAVVVDGNFVTSRLPKDLPQQLAAFLKLLESEQ